MIRAKNIKKSYGKTHVLKGISLELKPKESLAIMGASGEGKTTLLHILGTLETCDEGSLSIMGKNAHTEAHRIRSKHIGFIFQSFNLLEDFSLIENILMPARIARQPVKNLYKRAEELLSYVGLQDRKDLPAKVLSGGEKQRAAIARAFINDPDIILADEPTGNLDHNNSLIVHELLLKSVQKFGKSLIIATHDRELADLCDQKVLLQDGHFQSNFS